MCSLVCASACCSFPCMTLCSFSCTTRHIHPSCPLRKWLPFRLSGFTYRAVFVRQHVCVNVCVRRSEGSRTVGIKRGPVQGKKTAVVTPSFVSLLQPPRACPHPPWWRYDGWQTAGVKVEEHVTNSLTRGFV